MITYKKKLIRQIGQIEYMYRIDALNDSFVLIDAYRMRVERFAKETETPSIYLMRDFMEDATFEEWEEFKTETIKNILL